MGKVTEEEIQKIARMIEKEFPHDPALQQVHIARKIIAREAEVEGLSYFEYLRLLAKRRKDAGPDG